MKDKLTYASVFPNPCVRASNPLLVVWAWPPMQQAAAGYEQALHEKVPTRPRALTMTRQLRAVTWLSHTSVSEVLQPKRDRRTHSIYRVYAPVEFVVPAGASPSFHHHKLSHLVLPGPT